MSAQAPAAPAAGAEPARVVVQRRVEWPDTDAAGHYHHSTVIRWVEAAEAVLHERLELLDLYGSLPRIRYEVDYLARLWFRDLVDIELRVVDVGRSSVRYEFAVRRGDELAAAGALVAVYSDARAGGSRPWPDHARNALLHAGIQSPELVSS